jgi:hypothetical protein
MSEAALRLSRFAPSLRAFDALASRPSRMEAAGVEHVGEPEGRSRSPDYGGTRTLKSESSNLMMAKDFWQQVSARHRLEATRASARVPAAPRESSPVLATSWQRSMAVESLTAYPQTPAPESPSSIAAPVVRTKLMLDSIDARRPAPEAALARERPEACAPAGRP